PRVERPERRIGGERVDEAVGLRVRRGRWSETIRRFVEQAGRHEREGRETDQSEQRRARQRVAPTGIALRVAEKQPHQGAGGHDEVRSAVEDVPDLDQAVRGKVEVPRLDRLLDSQPDASLGAAYLEGVAG